MITRKLSFLALACLASVSGCRSTTSNRVAYTTQPTIVAATPVPVPVATQVAPACSTCPNAAVVPPPPPGFVR